MTDSTRLRTYAGEINHLQEQAGPSSGSAAQVAQAISRRPTSKERTQYTKAKKKRQLERLRREAAEANALRIRLLEVEGELEELRGWGRRVVTVIEPIAHLRAKEGGT